MNEDDIRILLLRYVRTTRYRHTPLRRRRHSTVPPTLMLMIRCCAASRYFALRERATHCLRRHGAAPRCHTAIFSLMLFKTCPLMIFDTYATAMPPLLMPIFFDYALLLMLRALDFAADAFDCCYYAALILLLLRC